MRKYLENPLEEPPVTFENRYTCDGIKASLLRISESESRSSLLLAINADRSYSKGEDSIRAMKASDEIRHEERRPNHDITSWR